MATTYAYDHGYGYGATSRGGSPGSACTSFVGSAFSQGSCRQQHLAARSQTSASRPSSYGSSQLGTTASRRLARFAHDMPPPDYFSSGASRRDQGCYEQSTDYSYVSRAAEQQQQQQQQPPRLHHSDSRSLSPADSISNVGSRASSRSGSSKRSRRSSAAGPALDCREGGGAEYPAEADWRAANRGWSAGMKPYYHAANGYWMVDLEPDVGA